MALKLASLKTTVKILGFLRHGGKDGVRSLSLKFSLKLAAILKQTPSFPLHEDISRAPRAT